jgi:site-specific recombinase XerD
LKVQDVDLQQGKLMVCEKGEKERVLDIHPELRRAFEECPAVDRVYWFGPDQASDRGMEDFSTSTCAFLRRVTGLDRKRARFHNLRHTFAVNLLRSGSDVRLVRDLLGHESLTTTMLYLSVMDGEKEAAISRLPSVGRQP